MTTHDSLNEIERMMEERPITILDVLLLINRQFEKALRVPVDGKADIPTSVHNHNSREANGDGVGTPSFLRQETRLPQGRTKQEDRHD